MKKAIQDAVDSGYRIVFQPAMRWIDVEVSYYPQGSNVSESLHIRERIEYADLDEKIIKRMIKKIEKANYQENG